MKTQVLPITPESVALAARLLQQGELVALPTETVYGIAADARNGDAVKKIFEAKGRPQDNPLIVHICGMEMLNGIVSEVPERAKKLAAAFWPGPLTMVMPRGPEVSDVTCAGLDTVGVRMPSHPVVQQVIRTSGVAFAAPSANLSGKPSPTTADHVKADMNGKIDVIIDGGPCNIGVESTVVSLMGGAVTILRPGGITREMLEAVIGPVNLSPAVLAPLKQGEAAASPGMKYKHYAPDAQVIVGTGSLPDMAAKLIAEYERREAEGLTCIIFATEETRCFYRGKRYVIIGERKNPLTLCESLFAQFRAQEDKADVILCEALPETDMGLAYMNRLLRSAGFKTI